MLACPMQGNIITCDKLHYMSIMLATFQDRLKAQKELELKQVFTCWWGLITFQETRKNQNHVSLKACFRRTTGTDVQGIIPSSVMTTDTSSGGVTSYARFTRKRFVLSWHCANTDFLFPTLTRLSGSPAKNNKGKEDFRVWQKSSWNRAHQNRKQRNCCGLMILKGSANGL